MDIDKYIRQMNKDIKKCKTLQDKIEVSRKYNISISEIEFRQYMLKQKSRF